MVARAIPTLLTALFVCAAALVAPAQDITVGTVVPVKPDEFARFDKPPDVDRNWRPKPTTEMEAATTPDAFFYRVRVEPDKRFPTAHKLEGSRTAFTEQAARAFLILMPFKLAEANRKKVTADLWVPLIFNPASAKTRLKLRFSPSANAP